MSKHLAKILKSSGKFHRVSPIITKVALSLGRRPEIITRRHFGFWKREQPRRKTFKKHVKTTVKSVRLMVKYKYIIRSID